ncbi:hypothetical protein SSPO_025580 [Streptomyces antimycoticus]|uniref:DUF397 domain-containing protein n=1 Tax=Streptomyces antimycoticus TaxID=68175 RepID=A0A499UHZ3_9ACTN|nr:DUF397 domain-containing protein [Streptomyces antimycoticus]BBJ39840.1 hypothetical protein SSPO_025580 [Streptomyces antimycoticus]
MPTTPDLSVATWRKSSYSNNNGGNCVEVADNLPGVVPVRDSKNPDGPAIPFPTTSWAAFIASLKA